MYQAFVNAVMNLTLEGPCIIFFFAIYVHSNEIHSIATLIVY